MAKVRPLANLLAIPGRSTNVYPRPVTVEIVIGTPANFAANGA